MGRLGSSPRAARAASRAEVGGGAPSATGAEPPRAADGPLSGWAPDEPSSNPSPPRATPPSADPFSLGGAAGADLAPSVPAPLATSPAGMPFWSAPEPSPASPSLLLPPSNSPAAFAADPAPISPSFAPTIWDNSALETALHQADVTFEAAWAAPGNAHAVAAAASASESVAALNLPTTPI